MKNFLKARIVPVFGIIALAAIIGFGVAGCKHDSGGGGNGVVDALIAEWYSDEACTTKALEFQTSSTGTLMSLYDANNGYVASYEARGNKLVDDWGFLGGIQGEVQYKLEGKKLTLSNASGTAAAFNGVFYKK